jgi:hypothetical protein
MKDLKDALADIGMGWNPADHIRDRAVLMRGHAVAGNLGRAEEYACEIERLQAAAGVKPVPKPAWATHERKLGYAAWAGILMHGYLCGRTFWMADPREYADYDDATLGSAQMLFHNRFLTEADLMSKAA